MVPITALWQIDVFCRKLNNLAYPVICLSGGRVSSKRRVSGPKGPAVSMATGVKMWH